MYRPTIISRFRHELRCAFSLRCLDGPSMEVMSGKYDVAQVIEPYYQGLVFQLTNLAEETSQELAVLA